MPVTTKGNYWLWSFLFVLAFLVHNCCALPISGELILSGEEYFDTENDYMPDRIYARVSYDVYRCPTVEGYDYLYAYQIFNEASTVGIDFFSTGILAGAGVNSGGFESDFNDVQPSSLELGGSPVQSVNFLFFDDLIDVPEHSALLYFVSGEAPAPTMGYGTLHGGGFSQVGSLPTPVPEPTAVSLFALGAATALLRNKRRTTQTD